MFCKKHQHAFVNVCSECVIERGNRRGAVKRLNGPERDEYLIYASDRDNHRYAPGEGNKSGRDYCTVDGVDYYRYDCYMWESPYGWFVVGTDEPYGVPRTKPE